MNKRIKKKRALEDKVKQVETMLDYAIHEIIRQDKEIEGLKQINSRNAQATNARFDKVEEDIKALKKMQKKSWFSRK
ncbi:TPA: hypothetical protein ACULOY_000576 [Streptococcus agalactiae]|nr:hypothetical protein [Streptococcus agalactiae]HEN5754398.1 hypothetical protein [Streptococcus agalactiae]HEN5759237.1 hypothetical protein [Streptococcus agalactiae]HEN5785767.1 hypothetical protein [Streptococcus agalactiae]HEN6221557.1 hypothetical protein [Streptococcus agalactiae]